MRIKLLVLSALALMISPLAKGCNACGCNLSGVYFGYTPMVRSHFVGINYQYASFRANIDYDDFYFDDEWSHDTFHRMEVVGHFRLSDRWQLRAGLPIVSQQMAGNTQNLAVTGFADPTVTVHFLPFFTGNDYTKEVMQSLMVGAGVKVPLGQFDIEDQGVQVNPNFQPGTGSWDAVFSASHTLRYRDLGWNTDVTGKFNGANDRGYQVGHQMRAVGTAFYFIEKPRGSWLPQIGVQWERGAAHTQNGFVMGNTGGQNLFANAGVQFFSGNVGVNVLGQIPLWQDFLTDQNVTLTAEPRLNLSLIYSIDSKKSPMP